MNAGVGMLVQVLEIERRVVDGEEREYIKSLKKVMDVDSEEVDVTGGLVDSGSNGVPVPVLIIAFRVAAHV